MWIKAHTHKGNEAWIRANKIVSMILMPNKTTWAVTVEGDDPEFSYIITERQRGDVVAIGEGA